MPKEQNKETKKMILAVGAEIVHNKGFNNTGIQEVLNRANVPKGSFYFYFQSKNDFGLQLIDFYAQFIYARLDEAEALSGVSALDKMQHFFAGFVDLFEKNKCRGGCPIGNMAQEMGDLNEEFRERLQAVYACLQSRIARLLDQARKEGQLRTDVHTRDLAGFMLNAWQGAILQMKVVKSTAPLQSFEEIVFGSLRAFMRLPAGDANTKECAHG
jgi:TetR/AcrR family transcriptional repressor of nem operon